MNPIPSSNQPLPQEEIVNFYPTISVKEVLF